MSTTATTGDVRTRTDVTFQKEVVTRRGARYALAALRIVLGFTFFWAFIDKVFGLGFSTPPERSWINGGSPTAGFLGGSTAPEVNNPFKPMFEFFLSWGVLADIVFMVGLLAIGVALLLGAGLKIAAITGGILVFLMYLAAFPFTRGGTNPIFDSHILQLVGLVILPLTLAGDTWGVGKIWGRRVGDSWLR
ncbi:MAG TPA: DoxX family protein [Actinomycetaceae bacterium]|nr:DoxX family protein [Actinomycetaceae bacterium]